MEGERNEEAHATVELSSDGVFHMLWAKGVQGMPVTVSAGNRDKRGSPEHTEGAEGARDNHGLGQQSGEKTEPWAAASA